MEPLSLQEKLHSTRNRIFWRIRSTLRFQRSGYREACTQTKRESELSQLNNFSLSEFERLEKKYNFMQFLPNLSWPNYSKNIFTLWALEQIFEEKISPKKIFEAGPQDFSRLLAYQKFFPNSELIGWEIDPFPVLAELHSRMDKANYYISLMQKSAKFMEGNFFQLNELQECIICFYPFVSSNPALAWGLPANLGNPVLWVESLNRNLLSGGFALMIHQGEWEEESFDSARSKTKNSLELMKRITLNCPFFLNPYPAQASLYRKK